MIKNDLLQVLVEGLNPPQRLAVTHSYDKNTLVVAGAGSGKTSVLTRRISFIIAMGYSTDSVLAVTFTNKAADEMRKRVSGYIGEDRAKKILMGTFHSICVQLLRKFGKEINIPRYFVIYDAKDSKQIMKETVNEIIGSVDATTIDMCVNKISEYKNDLIGPHEVSLRATTKDERLIALAYERYQNKLFLNKALDFDDLIMKAVYLLETSTVARNYYNNRFKFVVADEVQDTNAAQYKLLELIAGNNNIFIVGDDNQSIYGWRGARIDNIIKFQQRYPDSNVIRLEQNYRSTQTIVNASNCVIRNNRTRLEKNCFSQKDVGDPVKIFKAPNDIKEAEYIVNEIINLCAYSGKSYKDVAILCRVNKLTRNLEDNFMKHGIPYKVVSGLSFYQRKEIKDTVSMMKCVVNPDDDIAFERTLKITPKIGDKTIEDIKKLASTHGTSLYRSIGKYDGRSKAQINLLIKNIAILTAYISKPVTEFVKETLNLTGYIKRLEAVNTPENQERIGNIEELVNIATEFEQMSESDTITSFLDRMTLSSDSDANNDDNCVKLMTVHSAKGLEFDTVFVMGVEEDLLPHKNCKSESEIEEERRLLYVAMTRAEKALYLTHASSRMKYGKIENAFPSRFLSEIPINFKTEIW